MPATDILELQALSSASGEDWITVNRPKLGIQATLRVIRYRIAGKSYVLLTSLLDKHQFPAYAMKDLYHARWGIEEFFKTLKSEAKIEAFHTNHLNGVRQEIFSFLILQVLTEILRKQLRKRTRRPEATKGARLANRSYALTVTSQTVSQLLHPIVPAKKLAMVGLFYAKAYYVAYGGRAFPRISRKPLPKWRPPRPKKKKNRQLHAGLAMRP